MTRWRATAAIWLAAIVFDTGVDRFVVPPALAQTRAAAPAARADGRAARYVVAPTGNEARFRVREQLVGLTLPNDAVGVTRSVKGTIVIDRNGKVVSKESAFVVDVTTLKTDKERRDGYIQRRLLDTEQYPEVKLVPTELRSLPFSLPAAGALSFGLTGDLTIHGVTQPTIWQVKGNVKDGAVSGTATTKFKFDDFGLIKPRVGLVLTVEDDIQLEYDFRLVRDGALGSE